MKKLNIFTFALLHAVTAMLLGTGVAFLYAFGGAIHDLVVSGGINEGTGLAFLALIIMPALFAIGGFILGIIIGTVYNLLNTWFRGKFALNVFRD